MEAKCSIEYWFQPDSVCLELVGKYFHRDTLEVFVECEICFWVIVLLFDGEESRVVSGQDFVGFRCWVGCECDQRVFGGRFLLFLLTRQETVCLPIVPTFLSQLLACGCLHELLVGHGVFYFIFSFEVIKKFIIDCQFDVNVFFVRNELGGRILPQVSIVMVVLETSWVVIDNQMLERMWEVRSAYPNSTESSGSGLHLRLFVKVNSCLRYHLMQNFFRFVSGVHGQVKLGLGVSSCCALFRGGGALNQLLPCLFSNRCPSPMVE